MLMIRANKQNDKNNEKRDKPTEPHTQSMGEGMFMHPFLGTSPEFVIGQTMLPTTRPNQQKHAVDTFLWNSLGGNFPATLKLTRVTRSKQRMHLDEAR